jgi:DNA polymerase I-like protein with 3'-5' exonuclease and polymerase domains
VSLLAFDLETHLIQDGLLAPPIVCGSFADRNLFDSGCICDKARIIEVVEESLRSPEVVWCGANIAYDWGCILAVRPDLLPLVWKAYAEERVFDVLIAGTLDAIYGGRLRSEDGPTELFMRNGKKIQSGRYSLQSVTEDYLGRTDAKANDRFRLSYALLENTSIQQWPEEARQYPIDDAVNTLEVAEAQLKLCKNLHNLPAQAHAAFCAHLGSIWGMRIDTQRATALKASVDESLARVQAFALEHNLVKPKYKGRAPNKVIDGYSKDTKLIKEMVFQAYDGLPPKTDGGDISTSREALSESGHPVLEQFAEASKWEKLRTYADELASLGTAPMNVSCNILLSTGRASYSGLIQLIPRKGGVRECFQARPGHVWSSVDYAAIEMSTLAQVCLWALGYSKLADAINDDVDPHSLFAAHMVGRDYEDFLKHKKDPVEAGYRQAAKACLGAGTEVLTPRGWVPIVQVTTQDLVWDGESWVTHDGLIDQGIQEIQSFAAVEVTPDHGVLTGLGWREWTEVRTNPSLFRSALDLATSPFFGGPGDSARRQVAQQDFTLSSDATAGSSSGPLGTSSRTGTLRAAKTVTVAPSGPSATFGMRQPWPTKPPAPASSTGCTQPSTDAPTLGTERTQTTVVEESASPLSGSATSPSSLSMLRPSPASTTLSGRWTASTTTEATSPATSSSPPQGQTYATESQCKSFEGASLNSKPRSRVYDLLNAGPNHRFTIRTSEGPLIVSNCNFGFPGMMGAAKFVIAKKREGEKVCQWTHPDGLCGKEKVRAWKGRDLDAPLCRRCIEEAEKLRQFYLMQWPEMPNYFKWVTAQGDTVEQFVSKRVRGGCSGPAAANTRFQGLAADGAKAALVKMTEEMYLDTQSPLYGSRLMVFAHDETIIEIPEEKAHEAAHRQAEIMISEMRKFVPNVKVKAEPALMRNWTKSAEAKYVDGRLVCWGA